MLLVALHLDARGRLPSTLLWALLGGGAVTALLGVALIWSYMVPEYRSTFYQVSYHDDPLALISAYQTHALGRKTQS